MESPLKLIKDIYRWINNKFWKSFEEVPGNIPTKANLDFNRKIILNLRNKILLNKNKSELLLLFISFIAISLNIIFK